MRGYRLNQRNKDWAAQFVRSFSELTRWVGQQRQLSPKLNQSRILPSSMYSCQWSLRLASRDSNRNKIITHTHTHTPTVQTQSILSGWWMGTRRRLDSKRDSVWNCYSWCQCLSPGSPKSPSKITYRNIPAEHSRGTFQACMINPKGCMFCFGECADHTYFWSI